MYIHQEYIVYTTLLEIDMTKLFYQYILSHWGRVAHICVDNQTTIGSDNGLSPGRHQAIIWTNDGILLSRSLGTKFSKILSKINTLLKTSFAKWRPSWLGLNVLNGGMACSVTAFDCSTLETRAKWMLCDAFSTMEHLDKHCYYRSLIISSKLLNNYFWIFVEFFMGDWVVGKDSLQGYQKPCYRYWAVPSHLRFVGI